MNDRAPTNLEGQRWDILRSREGGTEVSTLELFFDLVYVFAISQLSHLLLDHLTLRGALETAILLFAVWWIWIFTTWATNWFDPKKITVRLLIIVLMGLGLFLSTAIPYAFEDRGLWFAGLYVTIQVGRSMFLAIGCGSNRQAKNFWRITSWMFFAAPFWIAGGLAEGDTRLALWLIAIAVDVAGPPMRFATPWSGRSSFEEWDISGEHMAERAQLFMIICLGESILLTGNTLAKLDHVTAAVIAAVVVSFAISVLMYWNYFSRSGRAAEIFEHHENPGSLGRAYTYFHIPMVAGIIALAVSDEMVIAHPEGHVSTELAAVAIGGGALYFFGNAVFNSTITSAFPRRRTFALLGVLTAIPFAHLLTPLLLMIWVMMPFLLLAIIDGNTKPPPYIDAHRQVSEDDDVAIDGG